ncbi:MAG: hypothetical protein IOD12_06480 [Silvanigrellales bacterium]|nr:hypothetical protein [Silvanigrellales bacterium]
MISRSKPSGVLPLADATLNSGPANNFTTSHFSGQIEKTSLKFKIRGTKHEGLSIQPRASFDFPLNSLAANVGADEWKKVQVIGRGMVVDASNTPQDVTFSLVSGQRDEISWEKTEFKDLAIGERDYTIEFIFPDSLKGTFANVMIAANKMFDYIEPMQPRPGTPASVTKEANRNQTLLAFQKQVEGFAASPATFKPVSSWYGPAGEPPDYKSDDKSKALRMDAAKVLAGMEAVRNTFHLVTEEGIRKGDLNTVALSTIRDCLQNTAPHWSDITIHYYCTHGALRGCYTNGIRATAGYVQDAAHAATDAGGTIDPGKFACAAPAMDVGGGKTVPVVPGLIRAYAWQKCMTPATESLPSTTPPASFLPGAPGGAGCPAGLPEVSAYSPNDAYRKAFAWLTAASERAELFRYMMDAPTFGLNNDDQQAVINAFWRVKNPADKDECTAKRPRRAIDPADGTHCLADKVYSQEMAPTKEVR